MHPITQSLVNPLPGVGLSTVVFFPEWLAGFLDRGVRGSCLVQTDARSEENEAGGKGFAISVVEPIHERCAGKGFEPWASQLEMHLMKLIGVLAAAIAPVRSEAAADGDPLRRWRLSGLTGGGRPGRRGGGGHRRPGAGGRRGGGGRCPAGVKRTLLPACCKCLSAWLTRKWMDSKSPHPHPIDEAAHRPAEQREGLSGLHAPPGVRTNRSQSEAEGRPCGAPERTAGGEGRCVLWPPD